MQGAQNFVCPEPSVELDAVVIDSKEVKEVSTAKLLGLTQGASQPNIEEAVKKASKRFYFLVKFKLAKLPPTDLILFYSISISKLRKDSL